MPASNPASADGARNRYRTVIVGSGFAGLGAAIRLKQAGIEDFVVLERDGVLGGTWWANTYPGCQCDIPSHLYSFSFAPNPDWSRTYSMQPEILEYLRRVSREHGIDPHIRFHHDVAAARWDEDSQLWRIQANVHRTEPNETGHDGAARAGTGRDGAGPQSVADRAQGGETRELTAELLIVGPGPLSEPKLPEIEGIESFAGRIFHSARWEHEHSLLGKRVAVIGTGASSIQFVPKIQPEVSKLHLFQRTPPWIVPHRDRPTRSWERTLYRAFPPAQRLVRAFVYWSRELFVFTLMHPRSGSLPERAGRKHLREQVPDLELRAKLAPRYRIGCKRTLLSNDYYPAIQRPNVEVVTDSIAAITPHGIVTADGAEREVDTIVLGTGFHVTDMPVAAWVHGRGGRTLDDVWRGSPQAYLGSTVAGFPNLFMLVGPNTGLGHNSIVFMLESQLNYAIDCIAHLDRAGAGSFEVREDVQRRFNEEIQRKLDGTVWTSGGCVSWYLDEHGRNSTVWPGFTWPFRRRTRHFRAADYELRPRAPRPARPAPSPAPTAPAPAPVS
ncbi:MAG TPA: NAD(P)/FAD-dependent oxidoreductase [Solirubrobacteraceae bacterium]|nr:NAD(P)/FAD-dependent oxidoreductase [Solirubrobacteraceae bacterium]